MSLRSVAGGGGDGDGGDQSFSDRVAHLERQVGEIERKIDRVESQMAKAVDLAEIKGRISQLPTIWQFVGLVLAIFGAAFALLRFGLPR